MPSSNARKAKGERAETTVFEDVTNPFCGTLPDDLVVERTDQGLKVLKNGCGEVGRRVRAQAAAVEPQGRRQGRLARRGRSSRQPS